MDFKKRLLSGMLVLVTIVSAAGCSTNKRDKGNIVSNTEPSIENHMEEANMLANANEVVIPPKEAITTEPSIEFIAEPTIEVSGEEIPEDTFEAEEEQVKEKSLEILLHDSLYDPDIDYKNVIDVYLNTDYYEREDLKADYLRAIYMYLLSTDVPMSTYLSELNTLMILQQVPCCMDDESWDLAFHNLILTLNDYQSLSEMYIDLATFAHELSCDEEHELNEVGAYTCPVLARELED